jgi:dTMP kinase
LAYQGVRGFDIKPLHKLMVKKFIVPDTVFLLDIDPSLSIYRIQQRGDTPNVFERLPDLERAREIFLSLKDKRIIKIDGSNSIAAIHEKVLEEFIEGPFKKRRCSKAYGCDDIFYCSYP